ncbi:MAG: site-specific DNA-methyltransferase [Acidobacteria bacterium]|nr:site-specific DNA-methyltransferase [Acidobacteriota bacterium]
MDTTGDGDAISGRPGGRFPANVLVSDDALNNGRISRSSIFTSASTVGKRSVYKQQAGGFADYTGGGYGDSGSFSRYFSMDAWWEAKIKELPEHVRRTFPFLIVPKASKSEKNSGLEKVKNNHPTVKPIKLFSYLVTLGSRSGDIVLDPFAGSGTAGIACRLLGRHFVLIERDAEYCDIIRARVSASSIHDR